MAQAAVDSQEDGNFLADVLRSEIKHRIQAGETEYRVAVNAGMTQSTLAKFRKGDDTTLATASKLFKYLWMSVSLSKEKISRRKKEPSTMNAINTEFLPEEFVDPTPLSVAALEGLGFPAKERLCAVSLPTGTLAITNLSPAGALAQFKKTEGRTINVEPHQQTVGDLKFLMWRLSRSIEPQIIIRSF